MLRPGFVTITLPCSLPTAAATVTLQLRSFDRAVSALRAFEKKDGRLRARAATNLSFLYFLEGVRTRGVHAMGSWARRDVLSPAG